MSFAFNIPFKVEKASPLPSSCILLWDFKDGYDNSTGIFRDLSGNGYDGIPDASAKSIGSDEVALEYNHGIFSTFPVDELAASEYTEIVVVRIPPIGTYSGSAYGSAFGIYCSYGNLLQYGSCISCNYYTNDILSGGYFGAGLNITNFKSSEKVVFVRTYGEEASAWKNLSKTAFSPTSPWDGTFALWGSWKMKGFCMTGFQSGGVNDPTSFPGISYSHAELYGKRLSDAEIEKRISMLMSKYEIS